MMASPHEVLLATEKCYQDVVRNFAKSLIVHGELSNSEKQYLAMRRRDVDRAFQDYMEWSKRYHENQRLIGELKGL